MWNQTTPAFMTPCQGCVLGLSKSQTVRIQFWRAGRQGKILTSRAGLITVQLRAEVGSRYKAQHQVRSVSALCMQTYRQCLQLTAHRAQLQQFCVHFFRRAYNSQNTMPIAKAKQICKTECIFAYMQDENHGVIQFFEPHNESLKNHEWEGVLCKCIQIHTYPNLSHLLDTQLNSIKHLHYTSMSSDTIGSPYILRHAGRLHQTKQFGCRFSPFITLLQAYFCGIMFHSTLFFAKTSDRSVKK